MVFGQPAKDDFERILTWESSKPYPWHTGTAARTCFLPHKSTLPAQREQNPCRTQPGWRQHVSSQNGAQPQLGSCRAITYFVSPGNKHTLMLRDTPKYAAMNMSPNTYAVALMTVVPAAACNNPWQIHVHAPAR